MDASERFMALPLDGDATLDSVLSAGTIQSHRAQQRVPDQVTRNADRTKMNQTDLLGGFDALQEKMRQHRKELNAESKANVSEMRQNEKVRRIRDATDVYTKLLNWKQQNSRQLIERSTSTGGLSDRKVPLTDAIQKPLSGLTSYSHLEHARGSGTGGSFVVDGRRQPSPVLPDNDHYATGVPPRDVKDLSLLSNPQFMRPLNPESVSSNGSSKALRLNDSQRRNLHEYGQELQQKIQRIHDPQLAATSDGAYNKPTSSRNSKWQPQRQSSERAVGRNTLLNSVPEPTTVTTRPLSDRGRNADTEQQRRRNLHENWAPIEQAPIAPSRQTDRLPTRENESVDDIVRRIRALERRIDIDGGGQKIDDNFDHSEQADAHDNTVPKLALPTAERKKKTNKRPTSVKDVRLPAKPLPFITGTSDGRSGSLPVGLQRLLASLKAQNAVLHQLALRLPVGVSVGRMASAFRRALAHTLKEDEQRLHAMLTEYDELSAAEAMTDEEKRELGRLATAIEAQDTAIMRTQRQINSLDSLLRHDIRNKTACTKPTLPLPKRNHVRDHTVSSYTRHRVGSSARDSTMENGKKTALLKVGQGRLCTDGAKCLRDLHSLKDALNTL